MSMTCFKMTKTLPNLWTKHKEQTLPTATCTSSKHMQQQDLEIIPSLATTTISAINTPTTDAISSQTMVRSTVATKKSGLPPLSK